MKLHVKTIIVITKKNDSALIALTKEVTQFLLQHSATKKETYTMYHLNCSLTYWRYVDSEFETAPTFDYDGLKKEFPKSTQKIKFWTPEICLRQPHLFDFVITVNPQTLWCVNP
jgi:NAD+ kinase